jgi:pimeloyl-ACP methyl ester carboxylesterase
MADKLITFASPDGLNLAARDFPGPPGAKVVLCLHGLSRNSRDFAQLGQALQNRHRVLAPDQRGRGLSAYDPKPANYNVLTQSQDAWALLAREGVEHCVIIGTSMGALMAIVMANTFPERIAGMVLNDAGPVIDPKGLARISGYVGKSAPVTSWDEAAAALRVLHGPSYPTYTAADWARMARATYVETDGALRLDYDPALAEAFAAGNGATPDMWPAFSVMAKVPTLILRGAISDILSAETATEMAARFPGTTLVTVADRGHAPDLSEPDANAAIDAFLARDDVKARW